MTRKPFFSLVEWLFFLALAVGAATVIHVLIEWIGAYIHHLSKIIAP